MDDECSHDMLSNMANFNEIIHRGLQKGKFVKFVVWDLSGLLVTIPVCVNLAGKVERRKRRSWNSTDNPTSLIYPSKTALIQLVLFSTYCMQFLWPITALASATVVFIPPHSLHFGEVTTIDRLFVSEKCKTMKWTGREPNNCGSHWNNVCVCV